MNAADLQGEKQELQVNAVDLQVLSGLMREPGADFALPKPYSRDIFLFDTYVAGTTFVPDMQELEPALSVGDRLTFVREPENQYDEQAIRIQTADGVKLGYVPRDDNGIFSRLRDAGKRLYASILEKEWRNRWLRIAIRIYLNE